MKLTSLDELKEKALGKVGTPKRDQFELELSDEILFEQSKASRKCKKARDQLAK